MLNVLFVNSGILGHGVVAELLEDAAARLPDITATHGANVRHDGLVFRAASAVTATSQWAARDLAATYPDCAAKVRVMPYPARLDGFDPAWLTGRADRAPDEPVRFLFMGGDFPRKG